MLDINQINKLQQENEAYKQSGQEANEIIAKLKAYKDVNEDFKTAWEELKAENEVLKQALNKEPLAQKALVTAYNGYKKQVLELYKVLDSYKQTLQEIKAIAEKPKPFKDFSEIKTATEVEYDYAAICNELELRLHKVLELITKAEEE
jgi:hypothetical protein